MSTQGIGKIRAGIIGAAGYTGGELLRLLINHPHVTISFAHSVSNAGNKVFAVHTDLFGDTDLEFSHEFHSDIDVLFLCMGHGDARTFLDEHVSRIDSRVKLIDLSQDHRLRSHAPYQGSHFVYGLPELNRSEIQNAHYIANPGCFATNIQLALLPLAQSGLLPDQVHTTAITGSTGAGQRPTPTTHFSWRSNNVSAYQVFEHRHLQEVSESLDQLQKGFLPGDDAGSRSLLDQAASKINFIPQRGDFTRGIFSTSHLRCSLSEAEVFTLYSDFFAEHPFTHVSPDPVDLKQVVNTNKSLIHLLKQGENLVIFNATDNLLKGASGQAVQNMNLSFGLEETAGLRLKGVAY